jgi:hypothetical protein
LIGQAVKPDRRRIRHLFYAPKRLQEFPVKAALRRDNEMIAHWQLHVTILCPVECDYVTRIVCTISSKVRVLMTRTAISPNIQLVSGKAVPVELLSPFFDVGQSPPRDPSMRDETE